MSIVYSDIFLCFSSFMRWGWLAGVGACMGGGGIMGIRIRKIGIVGIGWGGWRGGVRVGCFLIGFALFVMSMLYSSMLMLLSISQASTADPLYL